MEGARVLGRVHAVVEEKKRGPLAEGRAELHGGVDGAKTTGT